jgi:hypothetical protein
MSEPSVSTSSPTLTHFCWIEPFVHAFGQSEIDQPDNVVLAGFTEHALDEFTPLLLVQQRDKATRPASSYMAFMLDLTSRFVVSLCPCTLFLSI